MRSGTLVVAIAVAVVAVLGASPLGCTLLYSSDALTNGAAAQAKDAGASPSDAATGGVGCKGTTHQFCADFDEGSLTAGWSEGLQVSGGGQGTLDTTSAFSGDASFLSTLPNNADFSASAVLVQQYAGATSAVRSVDVGFAVNVDAPLDGGDHTVALLRISLVPPGYELAFAFTAASSGATTVATTLVEGLTSSGTYVRHPLSGTFAEHTWTHFHLHAEWTAGAGATSGTGTVTVEQEGTLGVSASITPELGGDAVRIALGLEHYDNVFPARTARFDDVWIDLGH